MKFHNLKKTAVLIFAGIFLLASPALAQRGGGPGHEKGMGMFKELNLTDDQKEKVKEIKAKYHEEMKTLRGEMKDSRTKLHEMMKSGASDDELRKQHQAMKAQRDKIGDMRFESLLAIRAILTPEQLKEMKAPWEKHGYKKHSKKGGYYGKDGCCKDMPCGVDSSK